MERVIPGIKKGMMLNRRKELNKLYFHISPPVTCIIRQDFHQTMELLTSIADDSGLDTIELILFPAVSNRTGLIRKKLKSIDMYKDLFSGYNGKRVNGVKINMSLVVKRFFRNIRELTDVLRYFKFPCLWNANFFIAAGGASICCNDQAVRNPMGSIMTDSIETLMENKENYMPRNICNMCNQGPQHMKGSVKALVYSSAARMRMNIVRRQESM